MFGKASPKTSWMVCSAFSSASVTRSTSPLYLTSCCRPKPSRNTSPAAFAAATATSSSLVKYCEPPQPSNASLYNSSRGATSLGRFQTRKAVKTSTASTARPVQEENTRKSANSYAVGLRSILVDCGRCIAPAGDNLSYAVDSRIFYRPQEVPANEYFYIIAVDA